jgi:N-methylhydantoinase A
VRLNAQKARRVFEDKIARTIGLPLLEAAYGVYTIAGASMMRAVKAVSTYRGRDPRDFSLLAFGGSGPTCAVELARSLEIGRVVIPPAPGLFSAFGLLFANSEHQLVSTFFRRASDVDPANLNDVYRQIERRVQAVLAREGHRAEPVVIRRYADLRYSGQAYELTVPVPNGELGRSQVAEVLETFGQEHLRGYGHRAADEPIDIINVRVTARVVANQPARLDLFAATRTQHGRPAVGATRPAYFGPSHGLLPTPILARADLADGKQSGPLIVEEYDATCVVPPGCEAWLDEWGNMVIRT